MQKKTFTKWVNSHLSRVSCRITDLYMDLRDGRMLIKLLEVLSGERLVGYSAVDHKNTSIDGWMDCVTHTSKGKVSRMKQREKHGNIGQ